MKNVLHSKLPDPLITWIFKNQISFLCKSLGLSCSSPCHENNILCLQKLK